MPVSFNQNLSPYGATASFNTVGSPALQGLTAPATNFNIFSQPQTQAANINAQQVPDGMTLLMQIFTQFLIPQLFQMVSQKLGGQPAANGQQPLVPATDGISQNIGKDDIVNYLLATTKGGTDFHSEFVEGRYATPGSRFATAGPREFDAATAAVYVGQFKAFALGLDAVNGPGKNPNQLADNISRAMNTQFTPEAEILAKVAAVYRGELTGVVGKYDNAALKNLLIQWGRSDLANAPGAGVFDVQSIGGVIKALNEEPNPQIRQAWLQQIFDFQNNSPNSPSGAVPNVASYQRAIQIVQGGEFDQLLRNYRVGIRTQ